MTARAGVAALALAPVAALVAFGLLQEPELPQLFPDSSSYLNWQPTRSIGYPLLLSAVRAVDPSLRSLPALQLTLFACATLLLAEACRYATGSMPLALFVGGGTLANAALGRFQLGVLSDAPFASLLVLHLASFLALNRHATRLRWLGLSLTLAGAVLVRPAGLSLLVPLLPLLLRASREAWLAALVPAAALWLTAAGANLAWRGSFALQEFGGLSMIGHVAQLIDGREDPRHDALAQQLADELGPWRRAAQARRWPDERVLFSAVEWNPMFGVANRRLAAYLDEGGAPALAGLPRTVALNRIAGELSRGTILSHPAAYMAHVAAHVYGLWVIPQWVSAAEFSRIESQFEARHPDARLLPGHRERYLGFLSVRSGPFLLVKRGLVAVFFLAATLGVLLPLKRGLGAPTDRAWFFAALNLHAGLLLVAAANAALWRYSIVWWPYALLATGLCFMSWRGGRV